MPVGAKSRARSASRERKPRSASRERAGGGGGSGGTGGSGVALWIGDPVHDTAPGTEPASPMFAPRTAKERMLEIKELLEVGLLTQEEFEEKRSQIHAEL